MGKKSQAMNNTIIIIAAIVIGWALYLLVLGNGSNFEEGDNSKHPLNIMGIMFKGGIIVPFLIAVNLIVISFTIERFITLGKVKGTGSVEGQASFGARGAGAGGQLCRLHRALGRYGQSRVRSPQPTGAGPHCRSELGQLNF